MIRPSESRSPEILAFIEGLQAARETASAHLDLDPTDTAGELESLDPVWTESLRVAEADGELRGAVCFEWEDDRSRAWMYGPWVAGPFDETIAALVRTACAELACGEVRGLFPRQNTTVVEGLVREGWRRSEEESVSLVSTERTGAARATVPCRRAGTDDLDWIGSLHEREFPHAYLTAEEMGAGEHVLLVDEGRRGYVSAQVQADGVGYIDFLAVQPEERRAGVGAALILAAVEVLRRPVVRLTVSGNNVTALQLYRRLAFVEQDTLVGVSWQSPGSD